MPTYRRNFLRTFQFGSLIVLALSAHAFTSPCLAAPRVELNLVTDEGFPITGQQKWLQMLSRLNFDSLRISRATGTEKIEVVRGGSDASPSYKVTGFLSRNNELILPNGRFSIRDAGAIADWKAALEKGGAEGLQPKVKAAFGLTAEQFVGIHTRLSGPVLFSTQGETPKSIVRNIAGDVAIAIDPEALKAFDQAWTIPEQMEGMSMGTVLAASIRPLGLVMVPTASESGVGLVITDVRKAPKSWPVGWPPEKPEREVAPKLYEFFTFEAPGNPLQEALTAIAANLELPLLYDHNGMARERIDPAKAIIKFPEARSYYSKVLSRILFQARMKSDLRVDEAGQPFLWIAPLKS